MSDKSSKVYEKKSITMFLRAKLGDSRVRGFLMLLMVALCEIGSLLLSYQGASLFMDPWIALVFAVSIQFCIFIILCYINVFGSSLPLAVMATFGYLVCAGLSISSAFVTSYSNSTYQADSKYSQIKYSAAVSSYIGVLNGAYIEYLSALTAEADYLRSKVHAEEVEGAFSKRGAGRGPEYWSMLKDLKVADSRLTSGASAYKLFQKDMDKILGVNNFQDGAKLTVIVSMLAAKVPLPVKRNMQPVPDFLTKGEIYSDTKVLNAVGALFSGGGVKRGQAISSAVPAISLEFLALIMGFLRYSVSVTKSEKRRSPITFIGDAFVSTVYDSIRFYHEMRSVRSRVGADITSKIQVELNSRLRERAKLMRDQGAVTTQESEQFRHGAISAALAEDGDEGVAQIYKNLFESLVRLSSPDASGSTKGIPRDLDGRYNSVITFLEREGVLQAGGSNENTLVLDVFSDKYMILTALAGLSNEEARRLRFSLV